MKPLCLATVLALGACVQHEDAAARGGTTASANDHATATATVSAATTPYGAAGHACAEATGEPIQHQEATTTTRDGVKLTSVGEKLGGVAEVSVAELLKAPDAYAGKTVRIAGNVSAMCTHRRAWFAIQSDDKSGGYVRVLTAPVFLVPEDAIGTKAVTEGVVEVQEVEREHAAHLAKEHELAPSAARSVIVRAKGAEFSS